MVNSNGDSEPFGTTPLPINDGDGVVQISLDWNHKQHTMNNFQQPLTTVIASFDAFPIEESINGSCQVAVNPHFCVYAVKKGLVRVLHRQSALRALLRAHADQTVTDLQFFQDGDVLATVGHNATQKNSKIIIWRIFERSSEIASEILLEIESMSMIMTRVIWHPFNPNCFWKIHTNTANNNSKTTTATLVETTRIATKPHPVHNHAVAEFDNPFAIVHGATQLRYDVLSSSSMTASLTDLAWCNSARHILTGYDNGDIVLWDIQNRVEKNYSNADGTITTVSVPTILSKVRQDKGVSRVLLLPHEQTVREYDTTHSKQEQTTYSTCFVTASTNNSKFTIWSAFGESVLPTPLQVIQLQPSSSSFVLNVCFGPAPPTTASPPSAFIVAASRETGVLSAFHIAAKWENSKPLLWGVDYVVPFVSKYPTFSYTVLCVPTADILEDGCVLDERGGMVYDMKIFAYQKSAVQCLTLTSFMCLPPEHTYTDDTPGIVVEQLRKAISYADTESIENNEITHNKDDNQFEEYDVDDEAFDNVVEDEYEVAAPDPTFLPTPSLGSSNDDSGNAFANWLGAIAAKTSPPPPAASKLSESSTPAPQTVLSPPPGVTPSSGMKDSTTPPTFLNPISMLSDLKPAATKATESTKQAPTPLAPPMSVARQENQPLPPISDVSQELAETVSIEIRKTVLPLLQQTIAEEVSKSVESHLSSSIRKYALGIIDNERIGRAASENVQETTRAAFSESIKSVLIPSLESITGQILQQLSRTLDGSATDDDGKMQHQQLRQDLESLSKQIATLSNIVADMSTEVKSLTTVVGSAATQGTAAAKPSFPPSLASSPSPLAPPVVVDPRHEIAELLRERHFEEAFTKAVSSSSLELTLFCCSNTNLQEVMGGEKPALSQPILLCLMQQLGTVLLTSNDPNYLRLELEWLQEIALSLNPLDPSIQRHVPVVLQQVAKSIHQRLQHAPATDLQLRRSLQRMLQLVRGMQMG